MSYTIDKVEKFIQKLHDGSYEIDPKAQTIHYKYGIEGTMSLADILAEKIHNYELSRGQLPPSFHSPANDLSSWIDKAFTNGVVKQSKSLIDELSTKEGVISQQKEEIKNLKQQLETLSTDYIFLQGKYDELDNKLKKIIPDKGIEE